MDSDKPRANQNFTLTAGNRIYSGTTNSEGKLEKSIPADAVIGTLIFEDDPCEYVLNLGYIDPINTISGIQSRLNNIRYNGGLVDRILGPITEAAVKAFQKEYDLLVDGIPVCRRRQNYRRFMGDD